MVAKKSLDTQLRALGLKFRIFGRSELAELRRILQPGEEIKHCTYGYYQGGSALLIATDLRLLLVDKRPMFLHIEDTPYETIREAEIMFRFLQATFMLRSKMKRLVFRSMSDARLRKLHIYVQLRMEQARNNMILPAESLVLEHRTHPAWSPHAPHMMRSVRSLRSRRPVKFHSTTPISESRASVVGRSVLRA